MKELLQVLFRAFHAPKLKPHNNLVRDTCLDGFIGENEENDTSEG